MLSVITRFLALGGAVYSTGAWWAYGTPSLSPAWLGYLLLLAALLPFALIYRVARVQQHLRELCVFGAAIAACAIAYVCCHTLFMPAEADCRGVPCSEAGSALFFAIAAAAQLFVLAIALGAAALVHYLAADSSGPANARTADPGRRSTT
jgi:hypothetical protein